MEKITCDHASFFAARREEYDTGGEYLKSLLRDMFPQPRHIDANDNYDGQYTYKNVHSYGIDRLILTQKMLCIAIDKNNDSDTICNDIVEPLLQRMFPPTSITKTSDISCDHVEFTSGEVQFFTTKYKSKDGVLELFCIKLFWANSHICFTTL